MAQIITKQDVDLGPVRIVRRVTQDPAGGPDWVFIFADVPYKVQTDDPASDFERTVRVGPLQGAALTTVNDLLTRIYAAIKQREDIPP